MASCTLMARCLRSRPHYSQRKMTRLVAVSPRPASSPYPLAPRPHPVIHATTPRPKSATHFSNSISPSTQFLHHAKDFHTSPSHLKSSRPGSSKGRHDRVPDTKTEAEIQKIKNDLDSWRSGCYVWIISMLDVAVYYGVKDWKEDAVREAVSEEKERQREEMKRKEGYWKEEGAREERQRESDRAWEERQRKWEEWGIGSSAE